jgi:hypothetical protein
VLDVRGKACELKFGLLKKACGQPAAGICQYCGRPFCSEHGTLEADDQQVCARKVCQAKVVDLAIHLQYRARAEARNAAGACGVDGCTNPVANQCTRCQAFYCMDHAFGQDETVLEHNVRVHRTSSLCRHCASRRRIWSQI